MNSTHIINEDGSLMVRHETKEGTREWTLRPDQLKKHAPQFEAEMTPGDRAAFRDAIREHEKSG